MASFKGDARVVYTLNGSTALHLLYMAFLKPDDEVLVSSFTFIATGSMVAMSGGKPVLCDIGPDTFLMDLKDAETPITSKILAIAPAHLFGNPCDADAVTAFAKEHNLTIVYGMRPRPTVRLLRAGM